MNQHDPTSNLISSFNIMKFACADETNVLFKKTHNNIII